MEKIFLSIIFLIPVLGLYSGLSVTVTVTLFTLLYLYDLRHSLKFDFKNYKLEIIFILWILASSLWSINGINSFFSGIKFITEFILGLILISNISKIKIPTIKIEKILPIVLLVAIAIFWGEYYSDGKIIIFFRKLFQEKEAHIFFLSNLDRGLALLTLLSWIVISIFLNKKNKVVAGIIYLTLIVVLVFSDNLAALIGHLIAGIVFLSTRFTILRHPKIICFLLLLGSILMLIFAFQVNSKQMSEESKILPVSAKHRLFIWNFVAETSKEHPLLGVGFNSSKMVPIEDDQIISYMDYKLHPLPLHPHNNILQVYFELGIIGLIIYLSLVCKYILIIGENYKTRDPLERNMISILYACFSVYFIIAMISYNTWQSWWVYTAIWIAALSKILIYSKIKLQKKQ